jgi:DNA-binding CsgD family transcriptional regulator
MDHSLAAPALASATVDLWDRAEEDRRRNGPWEFHPAIAYIGPVLLRQPALERHFPPRFLRVIYAAMNGRETEYCRYRDIMGLLPFVFTPPAPRIDACWYITATSRLYVPPDELMALTDQERDAAIARMAALARPRLTDPHAHAALVELSRHTQRPPSALLREWLFPEGVLLALGSAYTPQRLQIGGDRLTDATGRWVPQSPIGLTPSRFATWLTQATYNAAEAILLERPYPDSPTDRHGALRRPVVSLADAAHAPSAHSEMEHAIDAQRLVATLMQSASPRERQLFSLLADSASRQEAAAEMGIARATVDTLFFRLRDRAQRATS